MKLTFFFLFAILVIREVHSISKEHEEKDGWGKPVTTRKGFRGRLKNVDMSKHADVNHFNVDENPRLQKQVINNVLRVIRSRRVG